MGGVGSISPDTRAQRHRLAIRFALGWRSTRSTELPSHEVLATIPSLSMLMAEAECLAMEAEK
jgi:hypothetical protein